MKKRPKKISPAAYRERTYRQQVDSSGLTVFEVMVKETDLHITASHDVKAEAHDRVCTYRSQLESYIAACPLFLTSLIPMADDPLAPPIVKKMIAAGQLAAVGPMAAVAGAVAEFIGHDLLGLGIEEIVIENGGDIFLRRTSACRVAIFAGSSPLSGKIGLALPASHAPLGICTSSGTVGHSLSFGKADAVTVVAASATIADALATRLGNMVREARDIGGALDVAKDFAEIMGVVIVKGDRLGVRGDIELVPMAEMKGALRVCPYHY